MCVGCTACAGCEHIIFKNIYWDFPHRLLKILVNSVENA